jgi:hypothetical protein
MSVSEYLVRQSVLALVFCVVVPLLGTWLLYKGFQVAKVEKMPLSLCGRALLAGMGMAYLISMVTARLLPDLGSPGRVLAQAGSMVGIELLVIIILLRQYSGRALLVEATAVVLANAAGFILVFEMVLNTNPVHAGR